MVLVMLRKKAGALRQMKDMRWFTAVFFGTSERLQKDTDTWSSGEPMKDVQRKKKQAGVIKKQNWESYNLYGPLLKTAAEKRKMFRTEKDATGSQSHDDSMMRVHVVESGFRDLNIITPMKKKVIVTSVSEVEMADGLLEKRSDRDETMKTVSQTMMTREKNYGGNIPTSCSLETGDPNQRKAIHNDPKDTNKDEFTDLILRYPLLNTGSEDFSSLQDGVLWDHLGGLPAVTSILQHTMSEESICALEVWKARMIRKLGLDGFAKYQDDLFRVGADFHRSILEYLSEKTISAVSPPDDVLGYWRSLQTVFPHISEVSLLETKVQHSVLHYKGVLDCVAKYRGEIVLIDWKTSQRSKPLLRDTYDNPVQVAAYLGALNHSDNLDDQVTRAAIVVAYSDGSAAHVHYLNEELCEHYWRLWLQRLCKYILIK